MPRRTIVVTGASSGIGEAVARSWAARGETVVLAARDRVGLERVARRIEADGGTALVQPADVTREEDRVRLVERARTDTGRLDVLVNNAGRGHYGSAARIDLADLEALFALNVFAPLRLSQLAIDGLTRTGGTIVMMSSLAGVVAAPRMGAYAASKFALEALSMALRAELAGTGVRVVVVRPGPVDTPFRRNSVTTDGQAGVRPPGSRAQTPEQVAALTLEGVDRGRAVVETSGFVRLASAAARLTPGAFRRIGEAMAARQGFGR
jgi:short-subunit dehydrogenase